jgi:signal transduction histidine kinase
LSAIVGNILLRLGTGDFHDREYDYAKKSFPVTFFGGSVSYSLSVYPTDHYYNHYHTDLPIYACVIVVAIILITAFIFMLYDFFMNRQAMEKSSVLETRRQFVRFISHEIRTPLSTVHLGCKLLFAELMALLESKDSPLLTAVVERVKDWLLLVADIEESTDAAIDVLNDLINFDKITAGQSVSLSIGVSMPTLTGALSFFFAFNSESSIIRSLLYRIGSLCIEAELIFVWEFFYGAIKPYVAQAKQRKIRMKVDMEIDRHSISEEKRSELLSIGIMVIFSITSTRVLFY